ncbi:MAG: 50S ribosomal protein L20 [Planctomycetes bacterium]|nr:50S ribosomal protein L20 [Planctomycetota bacterium]
MRVKNGAATRQRRNRVLKRAKGFRGGRGRLFRNAKESTLRADAFAFGGRRRKKRDFRRLWITRLSAAAKANGMMYSRFINGCAKAGIGLNRKELSEIAIHEPEVFAEICNKAKAAIA